MTITSIGSSFSYIRPEAVARETAAAAIRGDAEPAAAAPGFGAPSAPTVAGSPSPSVADDLRALLVRAQESAHSEPTPQFVSRAYGGR
ncbi:MAG: hypothetical protein OEL76_04350 [Siculibacillus sp.]|nr:hypothetical protein [Siculibacillus sp.]